MQEQETVVNQTLMIWAGVVIAEIFVIAHLMNSIGILFACIIMYWPIKAALNWPAPIPEGDDTEEDAAAATADNSQNSAN